MSSRTLLPLKAFTLLAATSCVLTLRAQAARAQDQGAKPEATDAAKSQPADAAKPQQDAANAPPDTAKAQPAGTGTGGGGAGNAADKAEKTDAAEGEKADKTDKAEAEKSDKDDEAESGDEGENEGHGKHEKHEDIGSIGVDLVLGWGKVPFAAQNPFGNPMAPQTPTFSNSPQTSSNVQSIILAGSVEPIEHLGIGVRIPFTFATFNPNSAPARSMDGMGNVEFEGEYGRAVANGLRLTGALGVSLPTASGTELPDDLTNQPPNSIDQAGYDRWSMAKAAAYARGYEDNALFEPGRFGLSPKVGLLYRLHGLSIEPYIKVENLIATQSGLPTTYVGELVGALRVGYWVRKEFELAVRGWFNTGFAGASDDKTTSATVEPQIVLHFGPVRPDVGLLLPVAGPPHDNRFIGVRIGLVAGF